MKLIQWSLTMAMLANGNGVSAKNRRMLGEDASRLFGGRIWHDDTAAAITTFEQREDSSPPTTRSLLRREQGRRKEQQESSIDENFDGHLGSPNDFPHYEARSLDYFKKEMDPNFFEWVNPDEIAPGATTCGFLKPSLGSRLGEVYPAIEVYVCARFADTQPAAKGNFFGHCGGPVALSECDVGFNEANYNDFNVWTIDQRGLGRSSPSFIIDECALNPPIRAENGTIIELPPKPVPEGYTADDADSMKSVLEQYKQRAYSCWQYPGFHLEAEQEDGTIKKYHFLEYSGTRQLAEDIERMRLLMDAPYIHLWGVSYGTTVMAAHATMFPEAVGLFYIDSCESPNLSHHYQALSAAINVDQRIDYAIFSCETRNLESPGSCPVEDLSKCIEDVAALGKKQAQGLEEITAVLASAPDRIQEFCDVAAEGDADALDALYIGIIPSTATAVDRQEVDPTSQPTPSFGPVYDNPDYVTLLFPAIPGYSIKAQDHTEPIYNADRFIAEVVEVGERYTGAGTGLPVSSMFDEYAFGYSVIKAAPLPQLGSDVKGIIAGALYDGNTPYVWTQEMKDRFRNTKLITSQAPSHVAVSFEQPECTELIQQYFQTGETSFTDGYICGDELPSFGTVLQGYWEGP